MDEMQSLPYSRVSWIPGKQGLLCEHCQGMCPTGPRWGTVREAGCRTLWPHHVGLFTRLTASIYSVRIISVIFQGRDGRAIFHGLLTLLVKSELMQC